MDSQSSDVVDVSEVAKLLTEVPIALPDNFLTSQIDDGRRFDVSGDGIVESMQTAGAAKQDEFEAEDAALNQSDSEKDDRDEEGEIADEFEDSDTEKVGRWTFSKGAAKNAGKSKPKIANVVDGDFDHLKAKPALTKKEKEALNSETQRLARNAEARFPYRNCEQKTFADFLRSRNSRFAQRTLAQLEREEQEKQARVAARKKSRLPNKPADSEPEVVQTMDVPEPAVAISSEPLDAKLTGNPITPDGVSESSVQHPTEEPKASEQQVQATSGAEASEIVELNLTMITRCGDDVAPNAVDDALFDDTILVHNRAVSTPQRTTLGGSLTLRNILTSSSKARANAMRLHEVAETEDGADANAGEQHFSLRALKQQALKQRGAACNMDDLGGRLPKIDENAEVIEFAVETHRTAKRTDSAEVECFKKRVARGTLTDAQKAQESQNANPEASVAKKAALRSWLETQMAKQREEGRRERERAYKIENEERVDGNGSEPDAGEEDEEEEEEEDEEGESEPDDDDVISLNKLGEVGGSDDEQNGENCAFVDKEAEESSGSEKSDADVDSEFGDPVEQACASSTQAQPAEATELAEVSTNEGHETSKQKRRKRLLFHDSDESDSDHESENEPPAVRDVTPQKCLPSDEQEDVARSAATTNSVNDLHTQTSMFVVDADGFVIPKVRRVTEGDTESQDGDESDAPIGGLSQLLGPESRRDSDPDAEGGSLHLASAIQFCSGRFAEPKSRRQSSSAVKTKDDYSETVATEPKSDAALALKHDSDADNDDDEEDAVTVRKAKKRRIVIENDEDEMESESRKDNVEEAERAEGDAEEGEGEATEKRKAFRGFRSSRTGRLRRDFIEAEAELTSSDESNVSADEDERELVQRLLAEEQANPDQRVHFVDDDQLDADEALPRDADELRRQVERIHLKRAIDDDQRDVRFFKEKFLHDADHEELLGPGRTRLFRWRGLMNPDAENWLMSDSDHEDEPDETVLATGGFNWDVIRNRLGQKFNSVQESNATTTETDAENQPSESTEALAHTDKDALSNDADRAEVQDAPLSPARASKQLHSNNNAPVDKPKWNVSVNESGCEAMLEHLYDKYSADSSFVRRTFRALNERAGVLRRAASAVEPTLTDRVIGTMNDLNPLDRAKLIGRSIIRHTKSTATSANKQADAAADGKRNEPSAKVNAFSRKRGLFAMASPAAQKHAECEAKRARGMDERQAIVVEDDVDSLVASNHLVQRSVSVPAASEQVVRRANAKVSSVFAFLK